MTLLTRAGLNPKAKTADEQATIDNLEQVISITARRKELAGLWAMAASVLADAYADAPVARSRTTPSVLSSLQTGAKCRSSRESRRSARRGNLDLGRLYVVLPGRRCRDCGLVYLL